MLDTATPKLDPFDRFLDQHWVQRMGGLYSSAYLYIGARAPINENVMPNQARWERLAPQPPRSAIALYISCFPVSALPLRLPISISLTSTLLSFSAIPAGQLSIYHELHSLLQPANKHSASTCGACRLKYISYTF